MDAKRWGDQVFEDHYSSYCPSHCLHCPSLPPPLFLHKTYLFLFYVCVLCGRLFLQRCNTHYSPDGEPTTTDQCTHTTNIQHGEQWVLLGLFTGIWVKVAYRSRHDSKTVASPNSTPAWVTAHKSWKLWAQGVSLQEAQQVEKGHFQMAQLH